MSVAAPAATSEDSNRETLMANAIQVYGTDWCGVTFGVREYLTNSRIPYDYFNIEDDRHADEFVLAMNDGRRRFPLIVVEERILMSPTINELQQVLNEYRVRPAVSRPVPARDDGRAHTPRFRREG